MVPSIHRKKVNMNLVFTVRIWTLKNIDWEKGENEKEMAIISPWTIQNMFSVQNIFSVKRLSMFCEKFMRRSLLLYFLKQKLFQVLKRQ